MSNDTITELVQRLRDGQTYEHSYGDRNDMSFIMDEAADALTSQQAEIERLKTEEEESQLHLERAVRSRDELRARLTALECAQPAAEPTAPTKLLLEHSGCGHGRQTEQITIGLHRGDKVVLIMGAYTAAMHKGGEA